MRCEGCSLLYVNPRRPATKIAQHYEKDYIDTIERVEHDFSAMRVPSLRRESLVIQQLRPGGGRLLDIGTASGAFLSHFVGKPSWKPEGVEPSRFAARYAQRHLGVPIHCGLLNDARLPDASFDVVTSLDAFYFHPDPQADLTEIRRILRPSGIVAIEIPGLRFRLMKNKGLLCYLLYGRPVQLNAGLHLYFYSRKTLSRLLAKHGFELLAVAPEQSPVYGSWLLRAVNHTYFAVSAALYRVTGGRCNVCPKELLIYQKIDR